MGLGKRYDRNKHKLLNNKAICVENRELFKRFLEFEEYKLKRINGLPQIDDRSYKTLGGYIHKLHNVNKWFRNKPWEALTKADIKKVYDNLEDGKILTRAGEPLKDKTGYYNKIFRSKPFELAGKKAIVDEVMEFSSYRQDEEVRFIEEDTFRKLVGAANATNHKLLLWLAFDIGENINSLLLLQKKDIVRQRNPNSKEPEYVVNLPKEKLKRSRKPRSEITLFKETADLLDGVLEGLTQDDYLFKFGHRQALKFLHRAVRMVNAWCIPKGQPATWKDLRSSMACYLLKHGWSTDEIRARLGHKPSSRVLDKYVNYLAIGRHAAKQKVHDSNIQQMAAEAEEQRAQLKLLGSRIEKLQNENKQFEHDLQSLASAEAFIKKLLIHPQFTRTIVQILDKHQN